MSKNVKLLSSPGKKWNYFKDRRINFTYNWNTLLLEKLWFSNTIQYILYAISSFNLFNCEATNFFTKCFCNWNWYEMRLLYILRDVRFNYIFLEIFIRLSIVSQLERTVVTELFDMKAQKMGQIVFYSSSKWAIEPKKDACLDEFNLRQTVLGKVLPLKNPADIYLSIQESL